MVRVAQLAILSSLLIAGCGRAGPAENPAALRRAARGVVGVATRHSEDGSVTLCSGTLVAPLSFVEDIFVDGESELVVVGSAVGTGIVDRVGVDGTNNRQLFSESANILAATADTHSTYWLDGKGDLYRLDKP